MIIYILLWLVIGVVAITFFWFMHGERPCSYGAIAGSIIGIMLGGIMIFPLLFMLAVVGIDWVIDRPIWYKRIC